MRSIRETRPCERHEIGAFDRRRNRARRGRCAPTGTPVTPGDGVRPASEAVTIATSRAQFQATPTGQAQRRDRAGRRDRSPAEGEAGACRIRANAGRRVGGDPGPPERQSRANRSSWVCGSQHRRTISPRRAAAIRPLEPGYPLRADVVAPFLITVHGDPAARSSASVTISVRGLLLNARKPKCS
jgi:hypothetical protein